MLRTRVIPVLLLKNNGLYKTIKFKDAKYIGDPINAVKIFNEKEVDELVFLDIMATREKRRPNFKMIGNIASEAFMPLAYGGGINSIEDIKALFSIGIEKIIVNTLSVQQPDLIRIFADYAGSQSIVVSIDVKKNIFGKYEAYSQGGTINTKCDPVLIAKKVVEYGAGELIVNSIDRDGTFNGYDIPILKKITDAVNVPVIALGGAGKLEDFKEAYQQANIAALAAGSMFVFHGKHRAVLITYPTIKDLENSLL